MRVPTDALAGSNQATIAIAKTEDGQFEASCPSIPKIPKVKGESEVDVTREMSKQIYLHYANGIL